jgi:alginate O-acetyltransferase complex protein AlgI
VFFRAATFTDAVGFLRAMAGFGAGAPPAFGPSWYLDAQTMIAIAAGIVGSTPFVARLARRTEGRALIVLQPALVAALFVICSMLIAARSYNPFIYFRF